MKGWRWLIGSLLLTVLPMAEAGLPQVLADYDRLLVQTDPLRAMQRGVAAAIPLWPDESPAAMAAQRRELQRLRERLVALHSLTGEDALSRDLLRARIELDLEGLAFDEQRLPYISGDGFFTLPHYAADAAVLRGDAQQRAWLQKISALPAFYAQQMENLRRGIASGWVRPAPVAAKVTAQLQVRAKQAPEQHVLLRPLAGTPHAAEALRLVREGVMPAEAQLAAFFAREVLPKAGDPLGISTVPGGKDYYAYLIRRHASTSLAADAIHQQGLLEVARIQAEMEARMRELGHAGPLAAFLAELRDDPRHRAADMADYLRRTRDIAKRADAALPRFFGKSLPRLPYGVRVVDEAMKGSSAGYIPGSPALGVPGYVVVNFDAVRDSPLYGLPAWTLHEGVPGHHLQIALAQEREDLPAFRRGDDLNAYVEGWALYAEHLGVEMGLYETPHEHLGRLSFEMWRACRLVIDTGLHTQGWSREQALAYLSERTALGPAFIEAEIDRYIGWPGQALGYKLGELRIRALRREAEAALGARFDLRAFHDQILLPGPMPLDLLEREVRRWVATQK